MPTTSPEVTDALAPEGPARTASAPTAGAAGGQPEAVPEASAPQAKVTVWCNEDTPMIWAQLMREISGVKASTRISGGFDLLSSIMSPEGLSRFLAYIKDHPPKTESQKRRIIAAFLDKFAIDDEVEETLDLPGWTEEVIDSLSQMYDDDVFQISKMPGVRLLTP